MAKTYRCRSCGCYPLDKNTVGINKKLLGEKADNYFCVNCLAIFLDVEVQDIYDKIEEFKEQGCKLFE